MITSPSNQHVAELHALHAAKGRDASGLFLIEGPHLLEAALDAHVLPRLVLFDPDALGASPAGRQLLERIEEARAGGMVAYEAAPPAIERASDTRTPQGVVAAVAMSAVAPDTVRARRRGRGRSLLLVLDALADPGNVGTVLRSALAADVDEVLLGPDCADPLAPKVMRAGSGAQFHLPVRAGFTWDAIRQRLAGTPATRQVLLAEAGARRAYDACDLTQRTALIIGNEAHGPSSAAAHLATERITIPMWNRVESLNAAVAASVVLFEAARQRRVAEATQTRERPGNPF
ncbi:MAG: RNA methyltransferase [Ktedonobacterales bacterium]|nr:RNA methyltransferase [Ktedonobacterales bacterium]